MAIVKKYNSKLVRLQNPAEDIYVASFASYDKRYNYNCGQFLHLALDPYDPSSQWPDSRCFSIVSSPDDNELTIIFSPKGSFTKRMVQELKEGNDYYLKLPYGSLFAGTNSDERAVFIAGGTGISPFLSLFNSEKDFARFSDPILYLGVRSPRFNVYGSYVEKAVSINPGFKFKVVNEQNDGKLDIVSIYKEHGRATYFISGPPMMIKNFKKYLLENGLPEEYVKTDEWE